MKSGRLPTLSGGLQKTETQRAFAFMSDITPPTSTGMVVSENCSRGRARKSSFARVKAMPCSSGASLSTVPVSKVSTARSSETKAAGSRQSLSDRLTPSLISVGLVRGITPMSERKPSKAKTPASVSSKPVGINAVEPKAASSFSNDKQERNR